MKLFKNLCFLFLFFLATTLLTSCQIFTPNASLFKKTFENMEEAYNFQIEMKFDLKSDVLNLSETVNMYFDLEDDQNGIVKMTSGTEVMFFELKEDSFTLYTKVHDTYWLHESISKNELEEEYGITRGTDDYAFLDEKDIDFELIEKEKDSKTYEFYIKDTSVFTDALGLSENDILDTYNITKEEFSDLFKDFKYVVTIDTNEKLITKVEMDLSQIFLDLLKNIPNGASIDVDNFIVSMEFKDYGDVELEITDQMKK